MHKEVYFDKHDLGGFLVERNSMEPVLCIKNQVYGLVYTLTLGEILPTITRLANFYVIFSASARVRTRATSVRHRTSVCAHVPSHSIIKVSKSGYSQFYYGGRTLFKIDG